MTILLGMFGVTICLLIQGLFQRCIVTVNGKNKGTFAAARGLLRLLAAKLLRSSRKSIRKRSV